MNNSINSRIASLSNESWRDEAECRTGNLTNLFYSKDKKDIDKAKEICRQCNVASACLRYALDNGIKSGIWGGETPYERNRKNKRLGNLSLRLYILDN